MPVGLALPVRVVPAGSGDSRPKDLPEASRQFEALLIGQMLKSARGDDADGWLGSGDDPGSDTATELAEQQFAQALASHGGLGLSARIAASLSSGSLPPRSKTPLPGTLHGRVGR